MVRKIFLFVFAMTLLLIFEMPSTQAQNIALDGENASAFDFPAKSPLAEGDCYKIRIDKTGIFKITGKD